MWCQFDPTVSHQPAAKLFQKMQAKTVRNAGG
jgi:hypothetical protein